MKPIRALVREAELRKLLEHREKERKFCEPLLAKRMKLLKGEKFFKEPGSSKKNFDFRSPKIEIVDFSFMESWQEIKRLQERAGPDENSMKVIRALVRDAEVKKLLEHFKKKLHGSPKIEIVDFWFVESWQEIKKSWQQEINLRKKHNRKKD